jgi:hypothetical protein
MGKVKTHNARGVDSRLGLMILAMLMGLLVCADGAWAGQAGSTSQSGTGTTTGTGTTGTTTTSGTTQLTPLQMILGVLLEEAKGMVAARFGNNLTAQEQDILAMMLVADFLDYLFMQSMGGMLGQSMGGFGGWGQGGFGSWGR